MARATAPIFCGLRAPTNTTQSRRRAATLSISYCRDDVAPGTSFPKASHARKKRCRCSVAPLGNQRGLIRVVPSSCGRRYVFPIHLPAIAILLTVDLLSLLPVQTTAVRGAIIVYPLIQSTLVGIGARRLPRRHLTGTKPVGGPLLLVGLNGCPRRWAQSCCRCGSGCKSACSRCSVHG